MGCRKMPTPTGKEHGAHPSGTPPPSSSVALHKRSTSSPPSRELLEDGDEGQTGAGPSAKFKDGANGLWDASQISHSRLRALFASKLWIKWIGGGGDPWQ